MSILAKTKQILTLSTSLILCMPAMANPSDIPGLFADQYAVSVDGVAVEQSWQPSQTQQQQLLSLKIGETIELNNFPNTIQIPGVKNQPEIHKVTLTRYRLLAPGAKVTVVDGKQTKVIDNADFMAFSATAEGLGLLVNTKTAEVTGLLSRDGVHMNISGNLQKGLEFKADDHDEQHHQQHAQCHTELGKQAKGLQAELELADLSKALVLPESDAATYEAVIAVDTDSEWMAGKSNNTTTAMNYINTLFVGMNVFYERDLSLRLLLGDTTLRVNTDPYPDESNISEYLTDFGEYWRVNQTAVDRDFALLLSGQYISSYSFSGIAWINQYCQQGTNNGSMTYGSYSVNRIGSNFSATAVAPFVGHELGHNLGSPHTHCYSPTVDQCYNAESGCYSGTPVCPSTGNGKGTIMSYCHFGGSNGANCGSNNEYFHTTVINRINSLIVSNNPSCIGDLSDDVIFENGFESP